MALAHPCPTPAERDSYLPFCEEICGKYGTKFFPEDAMLLTDLFPLSANRGPTISSFTGMRRSAGPMRT